MWIRSQDRNTLIKCSYISWYSNRKLVGGTDSSECGECVLGEYESKERAMEILSELTPGTNTIYQMPKK